MTSDALQQLVFVSLAAGAAVGTAAFLWKLAGSGIRRGLGVFAYALLCAVFMAVAVVGVREGSWALVGPAIMLLSSLAAMAAQARGRDHWQLPIQAAGVALALPAIAWSAWRLDQPWLVLIVAAAGLLTFARLVARHRGAAAERGGGI